MRKILLSFIGFCLIGVELLSAQELYVPRNVKKAIENGTRTLDGSPGKNYWQNKGVYDIQVKLTPENRLVTGQESINYTNNSPDTLKIIAIRFVNNLHKPQSPRSNSTSPDFLDAGLDITKFAIDGVVYPVNSSDWGTVAGLRLKNFIAPHSTVKLNIEWNYPLSKLSGREGQIDSTTFFVAYCYPRVSVYDDYNGWDFLPHSDRQEFYNDFNDYKLAVSVPENYVVWATGDLLNPEEVLQPVIAKRLTASYKSDDVIHIADFAEVQGHKVTQQKGWNTWKFKADHITDMCFGTSKNYVWDASSVIVDPKTGRRASVQAAYNDTALDFHQNVAWSQHSLKYYSTKWPGVAYPFSKMTSFQGYADMEYPMMVNDGTTSDMKFAQMLQDHEIAHTYFPFYMGINETRYAYMDEGWATTFEYLIGQEEFGKAHADSIYKMFRVERYISNPAAEEDQPIITMSTQVSGAGYGHNSYGKASLSYLALKDLLGDQVFKKALHHYMDTWNGKHPIPWDYFGSINAGAGQNLNWFFQNWFFTNNYIDLKVGKVDHNNGAYQMHIENVGGFAIPFDVRVFFTDGTTDTLHQTPGSWKQNEKEQLLKITTKKTIAKIILDGGIFMDYTPDDNIWNG
ncbi:MAG TPA: M1 family metallopeptidase [Arachidicoccus sp.]|nr:M1 family metallopeptidase [Arachidicoccus sp.]